MTSDSQHLTEDERQRAADGTLDDDTRESVDAHIAACDDCASDVARIASLMKRTREATSPSAPLDELWPSIRARIEQSKVVPLATTAVASRDGLRRRAWWSATAGIAAALIVAVLVFSHPRVGDTPSTIVVTDSGPSLVAVADSAHAYEREAQILLDKLQLQRAMLRPDAVQALDRDLRVVDVAIAELKDAVARDPNNPALRQLLAASYRQKVDLLKRASNAS
jgi:anti-sigma factor RsiW